MLLCAPGGALAEETGGGIYFGDAGQAIASLAVFVVLVLILGRWAWKPVVSQLQRREEAISSAIERSEKRETEAGEILKTYRARMDAAEGEAKQLLAQSRHEAASAREQLIVTTQEEARKFMLGAKEEIEHAKKAALRELQDTTAQLAMEMATKILREGLKAEDQTRLTLKSLEEIREQSARDS